MKSISIDPNWISAFAALVAVAFSVWAHRSAERSRKRTDALELQNAELTRIQSVLAHQSWSDEYFREITSWSCNVATAISRAIHLVGVEDQDARRDVLSTLSACIDMGRWYFPNRDHEKEGKNKEPAYRGVRQPCLDWVVFAYDVFDGEKNIKDARAQLVSCQRHFVSCIQEVLDPRSREEAIDRVLTDFKAISTLPKVESPER